MPQGQSSLEAQNSTIEVYGRWQTEEYMPPLVVDVRHTTQMYRVSTYWSSLPQSPLRARSLGTNMEMWRCLNPLCYQWELPTSKVCIIQYIITCGH